MSAPPVFGARQHKDRPRSRQSVQWASPAGSPAGVAMSHTHSQRGLHALPVVPAAPIVVAPFPRVSGQSGLPLGVVPEHTPCKRTKRVRLFATVPQKVACLPESRVVGKAALTRGDANGSESGLATVAIRAHRVDHRIGKALTVVTAVQATGFLLIGDERALEQDSRHV